MNVKITENGIETVEYKYNLKSSMKSSLWKAKWIWLDNKIYNDYQNSYFTLFCKKEGYKFAIARFRKEVILENNIKSIKAWVSADVKYRLFINSRLCGRGPAEVGGDYDNKDPMNYWFYDSYDFTHLFKEGKNVICAEVLLLPQVQADYSMGHGGFIFEAEVEYYNGKRLTIISDSEWKATIAEAYIAYDQYDGRKEFFGWLESDYDDSKWHHADVVCTAIGGRWNLIPREIPPLMETKIFPREVKMPFTELGYRLINYHSLLNNNNTNNTIVLPGAPYTFWLDFGKTLTGFIHIKAKSAAGTKMIIGSEEIIGKSIRNETLIFGEGLNEYESFYLHSIRYLKITISNIIVPLVLHEISVNFISYPVSYDGDFRCSDSLLNDIYKVGRWTTQLCMQSYHMDSPVHQEALGCTGDYMIESLVNYYTFGDKWLTRMDILRTAHLLEQKDGLMFHTSYSLIWIQMMVDYYLYTGDSLLLNELAFTMHILLERFETYRGVSGLIENPPNYMFMDWVSIGKYNLHHPPRTIGQGYLTALYFKALNNAIFICNIIGDKENELHYKGLAEEVKLAFNKVLWVEERCLYCDGRNGIVPTKENKWLPEDADGIYFSQHTNALAVLFDIAPVKKQKDIMKNIFEDTTLIQAQPYFMHFILEAAAHAGVFEKYGLKQIKRWKSLLDENSTSLKEVWSGFDCDYSHAWSATPTYQLPSKILGVSPLKPGFEVIAIKPIFTNLKWAIGKIPTPKGLIDIGWSYNASSLEMRISIPHSCRAIISIPVSKIKNDYLEINNKKILIKNSFISDLCISITIDKKSIVIEIPGGSYNFLF